MKFIYNGENIEVPDFLAIDFETATSRSDSACAMGMAIVEGGRIVGEGYTLICPPGNEYDEKNIAIHGITPEDTKGAPTFSEVVADITEFLNAGTPIVAHNAPFDLSVFAYSIGYTPVPDFRYIDTMDMVKPHVKGSRSLQHCAEHFGIQLEHHHNALDDAIACANVAIKCFEQSPWPDFASFCLRSPHIKLQRYSDLDPIEYISAGSKQNKGSAPKWAAAAKNSVDYRSITPCEGKKDAAHPLYGKNIVFTGTLSIDRGAAMQMAADVGAVLKGGVSGKTDYLIVGDQDKDLVGADGMSTKEEKAYALNAAGKAHIEIISEAQFLSLVNCGAEV